MTLHQVLTEDIKFPGSIESLRKMMHQLGYRKKKARESISREQNSVALCLAIYQMKRELEDLGYELIYIDEICTDTACTAMKGWQGDNTPMNRGHMIIMAHSGGRHGFIP